MSSVAQIRTALAAAQSGIAGLTALDRFQGQINGCTSVAGRQYTRYGVDFNGSEDSTYVIRVYVPTGDWKTAQDLLDAFLSPAGASSIPAALEVDRTLGGVVDFLAVQSAAEEALTDFGDGVKWLTASILTTVGNL